MFCNRRSHSRTFARTTETFKFLTLILAVLCQPLFAQEFAGSLGQTITPANPGLRAINHPSLPTGELGALKSLNGRLAGVQPVQWKLPEGVVAEVAQPGAFMPSVENDGIFGLAVGNVYRFRLSGIATYPGQALYPTLELIGKLNPPKGKEWDFPVEIEVPMRDLALALRGNFVTRVIFVENSENAADVDASKTNEELTFDVPQTVDPVVAAGARGRALAILRLGSREPDAEPAVNDPFYFGLPSVTFRPTIVADAPETTSTVDAAGIVETATQPVELVDVAPASANDAHEAPAPETSEKKQ